MVANELKTALVDSLESQHERIFVYSVEVKVDHVQYWAVDEDLYLDARVFREEKHDEDEDAPPHLENYRVAQSIEWVFFNPDALVHWAKFLFERSPGKVLLISFENNTEQNWGSKQRDEK